jgi:putative endonuclease
MGRSRQQLGQLGEDTAVKILEARGYAIVDRNWRCPAGEVDIVARCNSVWVFLEVRTRRGSAFGTPEESLTQAKLDRMLSVAEHYLASHDLHDVDYRLDLIAIEVDHADNIVRLDILENVIEGR